MRSIHPSGVLPSGNALDDPTEAAIRRARRDDGLGDLRALPDASLLGLLELLTDSEDGCAALCALSRTSRAMRAFATHDDLWKAATLERFGGDFTFTGGSWMATYAAAAAAAGANERAAKRAKRASDCETSASVRTEIYSDVLYQRYMCAGMELESEWTDSSRSNVPEATPSMTLEEFRERFESVNLPVVIRGGCAHWPAMKKWSREWLSEKFGKTKFTVGGYEMALDDFFAVSEARDDTPLYLFYPKFGEKASELAGDYKVPEYFAQDDFFKLLGDDRPHFRWLIIGPERSGSIWHQDPNATSAWNAVVNGRKKWILFPPHVTPPGVHPSADGADVSQPVSLVEWFMNFYEDEDVRPRLETVCEPGDVLFVPSGWWHLALNLTECVAITQNYVSLANLPKVLKFLDTKCENLISGLDRGGRRSALGDDFSAALRASADPDLIAALDAHERVRTNASSKKASAFAHAFTDATSSSFSFAFDS